MKAIKQKVMLTLMCITIFLSNIIISISTENNTSIFIILVLLIFIIYITFQKCQKENFKIIKCKLDIGLMLFCISTMIPLIANKYIHIYYETIGIFKYITLFCTYIIIREIKDENEKFQNIIINTIIFSILIIAITGIDMLTTNFFTNFLYSIGNMQMDNMENRMMGIMGYENSFGILMAIGIMLSLGQYNKQKKSIYSALIYIFFNSLILSYSRLTYIVFTVIVIIYILLKKENKLDNLIILCTNFVLSIIFAIFFSKGLNKNENPYIVWLLDVMLFIASYVLNIICNKANVKKYNLSKKTLVKLIICLAIFCTTFIGVGLNISTPLNLFRTSKQNSQAKYNISNITGNKDYIFIFDIVAKAEKDNNYEIQVVEENIYYDTINIHKIQIGNYEGIKSIGFKSNSETKYISLIFKTKNKEFNQGLEIKEVKINNKKYIINYAYLPEKLVSKIKALAVSNKSVWERVVFINDAFKVIKNNWIFGIGANGWIYVYKFVQDYYYNTIAVHSYPIQVFLEYGIVGFIILLYIVFQITKNAFFEKNSENLSIYCALALVFLHSLLDFDFAFFNIIFITIILIALTVNANKNINFEKENRIIKIGSNGFILIVNIILILNVIDMTGSLYIKKENVNLKTVNFFENIVKYNRIYPEYILKQTSNKEYLKKLCKIDKNTYIEEKSSYILETAERTSNITYEEAEYIYSKLTGIEYKSDCYLIVMQNEKLYRLVKILEKQNKYELIKENCKEYIKQNYTKNLEKLENKKINRLTEEERESLINILNGCLEL